MLSAKPPKSTRLVKNSEGEPKLQLPSFNQQLFSNLEKIGHSPSRSRGSESTKASSVNSFSPKQYMRTTDSWRLRQNAQSSITQWHKNLRSAENSQENHSSARPVIQIPQLPQKLNVTQKEPSQESSPFKKTGQLWEVKPQTCRKLKQQILSEPAPSLFDLEYGPCKRQLPMGLPNLLNEKYNGKASFRNKMNTLKMNDGQQNTLLQVVEERVDLIDKTQQLSEKILNLTLDHLS